MSAEREIEVLAKFILEEVPGEPSESEGAGETAINVIREYQRISQALYQLLDDIDTADDMAKDNDAAYRKLVRERHAQRNLYFVSDGYRLYRATEEGLISDPEPERRAIALEPG